jgi:hypothetical protein
MEDSIKYKRTNERTNERTEKVALRCQYSFRVARFILLCATFPRLLIFPIKPFLPWVFMGEEIMLSTRFFTNGYDLFAPSENILAHEYRPGSMVSA